MFNQWFPDQKVLQDKTPGNSDNEKDYSLLGGWIFIAVGVFISTCLALAVISAPKMQNFPTLLSVILTFLCTLGLNPIFWKGVFLILKSKEFKGFDTNKIITGRLSFTRGAFVVVGIVAFLLIAYYSLTIPFGILFLLPILCFFVWWLISFFK